MIDSVQPPQIALVRYGSIPEVARCDINSVANITRGCDVVVKTHRGLELGQVLDLLIPSPEPGEELRPASFTIERCATAKDQSQRQRQLEQTREDFPGWEQRIKDWDLDLQLIELEWTLDAEKLVLYVLNERGPECTKLALQVAAAGLGIVDVQPVSMEGLVSMPTGGGCGSGGCGCHS